MQNGKDVEEAASPEAMKLTGMLSFKVTTQAKKEVAKTTFMSKTGIVEEEEVCAQKRSIAYLEDGVLKDNDDFPVRKKEKKQYLIPMKRANNDWRIERLKKIIEEGSATEEDKARLALMIDAFGGGGDKANQTIGGDGIISFSEDDAKEDALDADYNEIPIGEFGLAFLRGCGWKEEDGIGKSNRKAVKLQVSEPRPKGLGLGANVTQARKNKKDGKTKELEKNSRVKIVSGSDRGLSGDVQSMDEDNSSCFVKMDNGRIVRVSRFALEVVENKKPPQ
jgi:G patch domain/KOW motif-containing protein